MKITIKTRIGSFDVDPFDKSPPNPIVAALQPSISIEAVPGVPAITVAPYGEPESAWPLVIGVVVVVGFTIALWEW